MKVVNQTGIEEIRQFLSENHRQGDSLTPSMLQAWADEANFKMAEGNPAFIEIRAHESVHGRAQVYDLSPEGIDSDVVEE